ncbi:MAG: caspase family protein [Armatimonadetes bacterium]|nr:caspase family protein [Armatimonadota bacterium]
MSLTCRTTAGRMIVSLLVWFALEVVAFLRPTSHAADAPDSLPKDRPELALQVGHSDVVNALSYSPDGRLLASVSKDQSVKLWVGETGELLRTLAGHRDRVMAVAFSPDGKTLASAGGPLDSTLRLWDPRTGDQLHALQRHFPFGIFALAWSPDGRLLASGGGDATVTLWDATLWKPLKSLSGHPGPVDSLAFSPDGKTLYVACSNQPRGRRQGGGLSVWDVTTADLRRPSTPISEGVAQVAVSPDGSRLMAALYLSTAVRIYDAASGNQLHSLQAEDPGALETTHLSMAVSSDGGLLAASHLFRGEHEKSGVVRLWDLQSGRLLGQVARPRRDVGTLAFSPRGRWLTTGGGEAFSCPAPGRAIWEVGEGSVRPAFKAQNSEVCAPALFPAEQRLVTGSALGGGLVWDVVRGQGLCPLVQPPDRRLIAVTVSPDGKTIAGSVLLDRPDNFNGEVLFWNAATGEHERTFRECGHDVGLVAYSPDGRAFAAVCGGVGGDFEERRNTLEIRLWDTSTGQLRHTLRGHTNRITGLAFSPDSQRLVSSAGLQQGGVRGGEVNLWNAQTGELLKTLERDPIVGLYSTCCFSPDGRWVLTAGLGGAKLWDPATGEPTRSLGNPLDQAATACFSPKSRMVATASWDNTIRFWDVETGEEKASLKVQGDRPNWLSFSADGRRVLIGNSDGALGVWDVERRRLLGTLMGIPAPAGPYGPQRFWVFFTPEGYYTCSEGADNLFKWRFGNELVPFWRFEETFRRPDLARKALRGEAITEEPLTLARIAPGCRFVSPKGEEKLSGNSVKVSVEATDDKTVTELKLYVNGVLVPESVTRPEGGEIKPILDGAVNIRENHKVMRTFTANLSLPPGEKECLIRAVVYDDELNKSDAVVTIHRPNEKPMLGKLYVLCVGVNRYRNHDYNLSFAAQDAESIAEVMKAQEGKRYSKVHTTLLTDDRATKENIRDALGELKSATPADTVMVFLSGHGVQSTAVSSNGKSIPGEARGKFYFATHEVSTDALASTCLPWEEVLATLSNIYAKKLLFADACHSGAKLGERQATSEQMVEATRRSGVALIASSQGEEFSFEEKELGHGAFTVGLLEALWGKADTNSDGGVTLSELLNYAPKRVTEVTKGAQHPHIVSVRDFNPETTLVRVN